VAESPTVQNGLHKPKEARVKLRKFLFPGTKWVNEISRIKNFHLRLGVLIYKMFA